MTGSASTAQRVSYSGRLLLMVALTTPCTAVYRYRSPRMQTLLQERDQATERLAAEADYAFSQLLGSISEDYEGFRDGENSRS